MEDQDRSEGETSGETASESSEPTEALPPRPPAARPHIEGVEAAVAAGLVPPLPSEPTERIPPRPPRHMAPGGHYFDESIPEEIVEGVELPDWTDPPTREVPRVLLQADTPSGPALGGPVWRESQTDFDQDQEAFAEMVSGTVPVVAHEEAASEDDFAYPELDADTTEPAAGAGRLEPPVPPPGPEAITPSFPTSLIGKASAARRREARRSPPGPAEVAGEHAQSKGRSPLVATVTGLVFGAVALVCFWLGPLAVLAIGCLALTLGAAEFFRTLQRAHYQPATLLGLIAPAGFAVAAYLKGPVAIPLVMALATVATICWYLVGVTRRAVVANISVTMLGIAWVALLGSFLGLLLDPSAFPARHGLAYLLGALEATVAYDVGGYAIGSLFGRHKLAPSLSPNKTWEGLLGGSLCAVVIALGVTSQMAPWDLHRALAIGLVVAIIAPIGDLVESMIKRDLNVKDMGSLLPHHGGLLDRVDAMLFTLPAAYFVVRLFHG